MEYEKMSNVIISRAGRLFIFWFGVYFFFFWKEVIGI